MSNFLKSKNLSVTKLRLEVLEIFEKHPSAISTQQIESELETFDRVSLYRTLKTFKEKGIIHEITMPNLATKMALCPEHCHAKNHTHNHIHFHCDNCSEVQCVDVEEMPTIKLEGFSVNKLDIQASGLCKNCAS